MAKSNDKRAARLARLEAKAQIRRQRRIRRLKAAAAALQATPLPNDSQGKAFGDRMGRVAAALRQRGIELPRAPRVLSENLLARQVRVWLPDNKTVEITLGRRVSVNDDVDHLAAAIQQVQQGFEE